MHPRNRRIAFLSSFLLALMLAAGLAAGFGGSASAQNMTMSGEGHPAHIHTGLCPAPGAVVFPLTNVSSQMGMNGTPMAAASMTGAASAIPVETSTTDVSTALKDILDGNHSIVVHESTANIGTYILCGDIGGALMGTSDLAIGLAEVNASGYTGIAWLHGNGNGTTTVRIFATQTAAGGSGAAATPAATAAAAGTTAATPTAAATAAASTVAVSIKDYAYNPLEIDVPVGATVTWTNNDPIPHTVTQDGGGGFASKAIGAGETFSYTFTKAGTYAYHCEYHANMTGTVVVK